ncbi:uncharacterized protein LOC128528294 isoform X2 [Clarias gariepinus]|uniref:uncharacterized protein LOC128528294 isoform X2 n=1 Tax=Clarias gariepinus TaxID=13013 RepID=UPI00234CFFCB|nr:uncharacterized protein LOC128528294 isoform X2 [Clarias gariepinus]
MDTYCTTICLKILISKHLFLSWTDIYLMIATSASPSEGDSLEIFPAQIFGPRTAKVGENLILKCSFSNIKISNTEAHVYLCKNGVGKRLDLLGNKDECTFTLRNIALRDSGNYSCMYSFTKYPPRNVTGYGINSIHVQVTEYPEKNIIGSGHNSNPDQKRDDTGQTTMVSLVTLVLVGVIFIQIYRYRTMICDKLCQLYQGQSSEPPNMRTGEGQEQVNQTANTHEIIYSDMGEYATIPEAGGLNKPLADYDAKSATLYDLADPSEIYSLVQGNNLFTAVLDIQICIRYLKKKMLKLTLTLTDFTVHQQVFFLCMVDIF